MDVRQTLVSALGEEHVAELRSDLTDGPLPLAAPTSEAELLECLRHAREQNWRVLPLGLGSKLAWIRNPVRPDFALSTRALAGGVEYEPGDGTVTALAGTPMASLAATVAEGGHRLSPDVPRPTESTLGGVVAAAQSGLDRARYGPVRHHVLGVRVAQADGSVTHSGGRLVKNVTGFELHRLHCGAEGSLGVLLRVSLRLFALPEHLCVLTSERLDAVRASEVSLALTDLLFEPDSLTWIDDEGGFRVHLVLAGRTEQVKAERERAQSLLPGATCAEGEDAERIHRELRDAERPQSDWAPVRVACLPSRLGHVVSVITRELGAPETTGKWRCLVRAGAATLDVFCEPAEAPRLARTLREGPRDRGDAVIVRGERSPLQASTVEQKLVRELRRALDPTGLFASELGLSAVATR